MFINYNQKLKEISRKIVYLIYKMKPFVTAYTKICLNFNSNNINFIKHSKQLKDIQ